MEERARWKRKAQENTRDKASGNRKEDQEESRSVQRALVISRQEEVERDRKARDLARRRELDARGPVNNLPFTNLRIKQGIPGFLGRAAFRLDTEGERRFGEYPWRPRTVEVREVEREEDDSIEVTGGMGMVMADCQLVRSEGKNRERPIGVRGVSEKEKETWEGVTTSRLDRLVIGQNAERFEGGSNEYMNKEAEQGKRKGMGQKDVTKGKEKILTKVSRSTTENLVKESGGPTRETQEETEGELPSGWATITPEEISPTTLLLYATCVTPWGTS